MSSRRLKKSLAMISEEGLSEFLRRLAKRVRAVLFSATNLIVFELDLGRHADEVDCPLELTFRLASAADISGMDYETYDYDEPDKTYCLERLKNGDRCVLALHHEKCIGYFWIMNGKMELSQFKHIALPENRSYSYKAWVLKEFRGKRVLNAIDRFIIDMLRKEQKEFLLNTVAVDNMPMIKARERMNFRPVGKVRQFRFLGFRYDHISQRDLSYLQSR